MQKKKQPNAEKQTNKCKKQTNECKKTNKCKTPKKR